MPALRTTVVRHKTVGDLNAFGVHYTRIGVIALLFLIIRGCIVITN